MIMIKIILKSGLPRKADFVAERMPIIAGLLPSNAQDLS